MLFVEKAINRDLAWRAYTGLQASVEREMRVTGWKPSEKQLSRWGVGLEEIPDPDYKIVVEEDSQILFVTPEVGNADEGKRRYCIDASTAGCCIAM